ncbi:hypothetical protein KQI61_07815 [Anaerocolumna aminovalerica]|uniref:hypothetical protein n=1 Tax=Anaerocolumna aminovalerica TaxID=1527 RepID=UPI001C0EFB44|nr:hypothetical protein [Anaerocolumna aminovalerica]MBU5332103.1 hypothetical protein [Anaerocolumna aminovalerica]
MFDNTIDSNIETLYGKNFRHNKPITWKEKIKLYPVIFEYIDEFSSSIECLIYDPMDYEDFTIATLPRLYFLTGVAEYEYTGNIEEYKKNKLRVSLFMKLQMLLQLVLKNQDYDFIKKNKYWLIRLYSNKEKTDYIDINSNDFEELRKIILQQNGCNYSDEFIHNDIKNYLDEENKSNKNGVTITFEDKKEIIMLDLHIQDETIVDKMTIRRVNRICDKSLSRENYVMQTTAAMSGMVTFKQNPNPWFGKSSNNTLFDSYFKETKQV